MASGEFIRKAAQKVRPILSRDHQQARFKVLKLYRIWYRYMPELVHLYDIPKTVPECRAKLREEFLRHKEVYDIRVIDMLVVQGHIRLKEVMNRWQQKGHLMQHWNDGVEPKPKDFLSKFYAGHE
ncbi:NADH dehydrogenase [ubiquinone] 1 alpha subcomplex subunit 6-like [Uranotaenia lowii]|uniref:NADH dehydrogenase [ubiquinone] 1 alpha subcomplex subunit 6-like n=1 Tax=Uranotaenia lowii TaxID=190385 RepID=UPI0024787661|nr:NADH dehydrogenase [ubiquinone] 1 alpha subcomplex subunit 6-like [Uranotaenia lowii]